MTRFSTPITFANPQIQNLSMKNEIDIAINEVLKSDTYILGEQVSLFEQEFAKYNGRNFAVGVNSGTDALVLAMRSLNIGLGDQVIVPSLTAIATVAAVFAVGATPVLIDINSDTFTIDVNKLDHVKTKFTRAVIAVHLYGHPAEISLISDWCVQNNLDLIEDCSQAHGAEWQNQKVGTFGKIACFSFYPTKNLGAIGDGGAIVVDDPQLYENLIKYRQYGWDSLRNSQILSTVSRLDEIQAAILRVKLRKIDSLNNSRIRIARVYSQNLNREKYALPYISMQAKHVFHLYVIRTEDRDFLLENVKKSNLFPGIHYRLPVHGNFAYAHLNNQYSGFLHESEVAANEVVSLPMYPELTEDLQRTVIDILNDI